MLAALVNSPMLGTSLALMLLVSTASTVAYVWATLAPTWSNDSQADTWQMYAHDGWIPCTVRRDGRSVTWTYPLGISRVG